jgi:hypothetical protein
MRASWLLLATGWAIAGLPASERPRMQALGSEGLVAREPSGGSSGDYFVVYRAVRRIQAIDCSPEDGGLSCIERVGPSLRRAVVPYRFAEGRLEGALDHLADAGAPGCESMALRTATEVYELPSRSVSYSRIEAGRALAGRGAPIGTLDAGTRVHVVEVARDRAGEDWLAIIAPLRGWVPARLDCR